MGRAVDPSSHVWAYFISFSFSFGKISQMEMLRSPLAERVGRALRMYAFLSPVQLFLNFMQFGEIFTQIIGW